MARVPVHLSVLLTVLVIHSLSSFTDGAKLRILAFHPYLSSADSMCQSFGSWDPAILKLVEFELLSANLHFPWKRKFMSSCKMCSSGKTCLQAPFVENGQGTWFHNDKNPTRIDESLGYVLDYMRKTGPYDGLYGFSQGAMMAGYLTAGQYKKMVFAGRSTADIPPIRFAVLQEGGHIRGILDGVYTGPVQVPSMHIIGVYDPSRQFEEDWLQDWEKPAVMRLLMGHTYLTRKEMDAGTRSNLVNFFTSHS